MLGDKITGLPTSPHHTSRGHTFINQLFYLIGLGGLAVSLDVDRPREVRARSCEGILPRGRWFKVVNHEHIVDPPVLRDLQAIC